MLRGPVHTTVATIDFCFYSASCFLVILRLAKSCDVSASVQPDLARLSAHVNDDHGMMDEGLKSSAAL